MLIQFTKGSTGKPSTLHCIREDGSVSWTKLQPALEFHDLAHYVVETELGFTMAFYGLLSKGYSIEDFELPREQRPFALVPANLPLQALQTEHIVNLLQTMDESIYSNEEILVELHRILSQNDLAYPEHLDAKIMASIRFRIKGLVHKWNGLQAGEKLELEF